MSKYSVVLEWSDEDEGYIATVPEFPNLSAFGDSAQEALEQAMQALELYQETCHSEGIPLPPPRRRAGYSGQFRLRIPASLHGNLAQTAEREGVSLNTLVVAMLSEAYGLDRAAEIQRMATTVTAEIVARQVTQYDRTWTGAPDAVGTPMRRQDARNEQVTAFVH